jgi:hypothetical protein
MSELNGRKVLKVQTHDTFLVDNWGNTKSTISAKAENTIGDLELTYMDGGVFIKGQGRVSGKKFEFLIPSALCKVIQFVNE